MIHEQAMCNGTGKQQLQGHKGLQAGVGRTTPAFSKKPAQSLPSPPNLDHPPSTITWVRIMALACDAN